MFGESGKQIERYVAEGMPCTGTAHKRRFPWPEVRNWRDERLRRMERDKSAREKPTDINEAKRRKEAAFAEKAELEVAEMRGELIPLDVHESRVDALTLRLSGACKGLDRYIADVQRVTTAAESKVLLDRISDGLLLALQGLADEVIAEAHAEGEADDERDVA